MIYYFPLESLKSRYTHQLSTKWMPNAFNTVDAKWTIVDGNYEQGDVKVGMVLDAVGRGIYSMNQCKYFLELIQQGKIEDGDIIYLQDYWTPGIESIFYALDLYKINVKVYARCWAQSVDEFDFTYNMRHWMRYYELGLDERLSGIFVASTINRDELKQAGFKTPIHVTALPINYDEIYNYVGKDVEKEKIVVFSSRLDWEKNPMFMMEVAKKFLNNNQDYKWVYTTSASELRSNDRFIIHKLKELEKENDRFIIKTNMHKKSYYELLSRASIQFSSCLQDYVSFTLLEATTFGCEICYPRFKSFPECVPSDRLYDPFDVNSALDILDNIVQNDITLRRTYEEIPKLSSLGTLLDAYIVGNGIDREVNIWNESEYYTEFLKSKKIIGDKL